MSCGCSSSIQPWHSRGWIGGCVCWPRVSTPQADQWLLQRVGERPLDLGIRFSFKDDAGDAIRRDGTQLSWFFVIRCSKAMAINLLGAMGKKRRCRLYGTIPSLQAKMVLLFQEKSALTRSSYEFAVQYLEEKVTSKRLAIKLFCVIFGWWHVYTKEHDFLTLLIFQVKYKRTW